MGKGDFRRPAWVSPSEFQRRWSETFRPADEVRPRSGAVVRDGETVGWAPSEGEVGADATDVGGARDLLAE